MKSDHCRFQLITTPEGPTPGPGAGCRARGSSEAMTLGQDESPGPIFLGDGGSCVCTSWTRVHAACRPCELAVHFVGWVPELLRPSTAGCLPRGNLALVSAKYGINIYKKYSVDVSLWFMVLTSKHLDDFKVCYSIAKRLDGKFFYWRLKDVFISMCKWEINWQFFKNWIYAIDCMNILIRYF